MRRERLAGPERRERVLSSACELFARSGYRGATTAEIAREVGVSEPILYRHFASKRDLFLACLDELWAGARAAWEETLATPAPLDWLASSAAPFARLRETKGRLAALWVQALAEAGEDDVIRERLREHLHDVHAFVADAMRALQERGHVLPERDPQAEAWVFLALNLLGGVGPRIGGLVEDDYERIRAARHAWLTGAEGGGEVARDQG